MREHKNRRLTTCCAMQLSDVDVEGDVTHVVEDLGPEEMRVVRLASVVAVLPEDEGVVEPLLATFEAEHHVALLALSRLVLRDDHLDGRVDAELRLELEGVVREGDDEEEAGEGVLVRVGRVAMEDVARGEERADG